MTRNGVRHCFLNFGFSKLWLLRNVRFRPNQTEALSSYNQSIYGTRKTESRPFARHAGHARSQDSDARAFAWVCDRATDPAIVGRSATRRRRLALPGAAAAGVEWLDRWRMGPLGQQSARSLLQVNRGRPQTFDEGVGPLPPGHRRRGPHYGIRVITRMSMQADSRWKRFRRRLRYWLDRRERNV